MNNEDRARAWLKHTAENPYEYHRTMLARLLDTAEARGRKKAIEDCIAALEHDPHSWRDCSAPYFCRTKVDELRAMLADDAKEPAND